MSEQAKNKKIDSGMGEALFSDRERFEMWFAENWKKTAIISLVAVTALSVGFGISNNIKKNRAAGAAELSAANTVEALNAKLAQYSSNPAAPIARLRLANMLFDLAKYSDAILHLEKIAADKNADAVLVGTAKLNIAKALELNGKLEDAAKQFSKTAAECGDNFSIKSEAVYGAARLYAKLGKTALALGELRNLNAPAGQTDAYAADAASLKVAIENGEYGKIK